MSVFSISQLNNDSIGCLTFETAVENKSLAALSLCFNDSSCPLIPLTGVNLT